MLREEKYRTGLMKYSTEISVLKLRPKNINAYLSHKAVHVKETQLIERYL